MFRGAPRLDLRFSDTLQEKAFSNVVERDVLTATVFLCIVSFVGLVLMCAAELPQELDHPSVPFVWGIEDPRTLFFCLLLAQSSWHCLLAIAVGLQLWRGWPRCDWETCALVTFTVDTLHCLFGNRAVLPLLYNNTTSMDTPPNSEMNVLMLASLVIITACMFSSVRFHRVWVIPCLAAAALIALTRMGVFSGEWGPPAAGSILCLTLVCATWQKESNRRQTWCLIRDLKDQERELERRCAITMRLLHSFCDCVLTLDSDLNVLEPSPQFAALLMRPHRGMPMSASIRNFIVSEEDYARLRAAVGTGTLEGGIAEHLAVRLRGSMGQSVNVHMYVASVCKAVGVEHMIGVVEASIGAASEAEDKALPELELASVSVLPSTNESCCDDQLFADTSSMWDEDSRMSNPMPEPLCATISMTARMEVRASNAAFAEAFKNDSGCVHEFFGLCLRDAESFGDWLSTARAEILAERVALPITRAFGLVSVRSNKAGLHGPLHLNVSFPRVRGRGSMEEHLSGESYFVRIILDKPGDQLPAQSATQLLAILPGAPSLDDAP